MQFIDLKANYRALKPEIDANIQAVLGFSQFIGGYHVKEAERCNAAFAGEFVTPFVAESCVSIWAQYALLAENAVQRDRITAQLTEKGIPNMVYYPTPQHTLPVFRDAPVYGETYRNANDFCARTFSLPIHPYLTEAEQNEIIEAVLEMI